jgi:hypothetical protein
MHWLGRRARVQDEEADFRVLQGLIDCAEYLKIDPVLVPVVLSFAFNARLTAFQSRLFLFATSLTLSVRVRTQTPTVTSYPLRKRKNLPNPKVGMTRLHDLWNSLQL